MFFLSPSLTASAPQKTDLHVNANTVIPTTGSMTVMIKNGPTIIGKEGDEVILQPVVSFRDRPLLPSSSSALHAGLSFDWLKDGQILTFGPRIKLIAKDSIRIMSLIRSDRGIYQVIVKWVTHVVQNMFSSNKEFFPSPCCRRDDDGSQAVARVQLQMQGKETQMFTPISLLISDPFSRIRKTFKIQSGCQKWPRMREKSEILMAAFARLWGCCENDATVRPPGPSVMCPPFHLWFFRLEWWWFWSSSETGPKEGEGKREQNVLSCIFDGWCLILPAPCDS